MSGGRIWRVNVPDPLCLNILQNDQLLLCPVIQFVLQLLILNPGNKNTIKKKTSSTFLEHSDLRSHAHSSGRMRLSRNTQVLSSACQTGLLMLWLSTPLGFFYMSGMSLGRHKIWVTAMKTGSAFLKTVNFPWCSFTKTGSCLEHTFTLR